MLSIKSTLAHRVHQYSDMFSSSSDHLQGIIHPTSICYKTQINYQIDLKILIYLISHLCFIYACFT